MIIAFLAALALPQPAPPIFICNLGKKHVEVREDSGELHYRFGTRSRPELELRAAPESNSVFYHRTLYNRGEDQSLRFTNGKYDYVIYSMWRAPSGRSAEDIEGGLLVLLDGVVQQKHTCRKGGDMLEYPIFKLLPIDETNWADAGTP
jgi:hypothetical protein